MPKSVSETDDACVPAVDRRGKPGEEEPLPVAAPALAGRREVERALLEGEHRLRTVLSSEFLPIFFHSEGRILDANDAAARLFGYSREELLEISLFDLIVAEDRGRAREYADAHEQHPYELLGLRKDGSTVPLDVEGRDIMLDGLPGRVVFVRDATERRRVEAEQQAIEAQLRQAQKMEALGELAAGVAHNFNNMLAVILGFAKVLLAQLPEESEAHSYAEQISLAGTRATELTKALLVFSRRDAAEPGTLEINDVVAGTQTLLRELIPPSVDIDVRLAPSLPAIAGNIVQFEQVLVNLAVNARDAMPSGGRLVIETDQLEVTESTRAAALRPGRYVTLKVGDTGVGMDAETRRRVFEPFFTTKEPGRGTGLGLSTAYGIVDQAGGRIEVDSRTGRGTTFTIYLPASAA